MVANACLPVACLQIDRHGGVAWEDDDASDEELIRRSCGGDDGTASGLHSEMADEVDTREYSLMTKMCVVRPR